MEILFLQKQCTLNIILLKGNRMTPNEIFQKANTLSANLKIDEADELYNYLLSVSPSEKIYNNKSLNFRRGLRLPEALESINKALSTNPDYVMGNIAKFELLAYMGKYKEAMPYQEWNFADKVLSHPDYELSKRKRLDFSHIAVQEALQCRFGIKEPVVSETYEETLSKVQDSIILVSSSQGLGDVIQCSYYVKELLKYNPKKIIFSVRKELTRVFSDLGVEVINFIPEEDSYDYFIPIFSLMKLLGGDDAPKDAWLDIPKKELNPDSIGIIWKGNPNHSNDKYRSLSLYSMLEELKDFKNICSLQFDSTPEEKQLLKERGILDLSSSISDLYDIGSYMKSMKLVVSIDSAPVHLAGALGVNSLCLMPKHREDWRWGFSGDHKHYSSVKLIRF